LEAARLPRPPTLPNLIRFGLIALLLVLAVLAWAVTDDRMSGMDAGPGTDPGTLGWFLGVWVVMMAAMMFPSIAPMVMMYARIQRGRQERGQAAPVGATTIFVSGYLISWAAAGLAGYWLFKAGQALAPQAFSWDEGGPYLAGGIIVLAAVYQLTPLKDMCLRHCRSPLMFILQHYKPRRGGALWMGIEHGGYCVGCCWALMAALFALGVMSLVWMAFVAALIALEKTLPWGRPATYATALVLLVLGVVLIAAPDAVPGLTVPGDGGMDAMSMH
jgi:predicted metal-binding membrane protein